MINKIVFISTPYSRTIRHIKTDNVLIIEVPKEAQSSLADVDCEDLNFEDGMTIPINSGGGVE